MIVFNNNNNNNSVFHILYEEYRQCFIINASVGQLALLLVMTCTDVNDQLCCVCLLHTSCKVAVRLSLRYFLVL